MSFIEFVPIIGSSLVHLLVVFAYFLKGPRVFPEPFQHGPWNQLQRMTVSLLWSEALDQEFYAGTPALDFEEFLGPQFLHLSVGKEELDLNTSKILSSP